MNVLGLTDTGALAARIGATENLQRIFFPFIGTLDTPWYIGSVGQVTSAAINPQLVSNGLGALGGGSITVTAGGNVTDLTTVADSSLATASATSSAGGLPTSALLTMGSGDVTINAASNVLGGRVDVASGRADIAAGGNIENGSPLLIGIINSTNVTDNGVETSLNTPEVIADEFALRIADATAELKAGGSISIQGVAALAPSQPTVLNGFSGTPSGAGLTSLDNRAGFYSPVSGLDLLANGSVLVTYDKQNSGAFLGQLVGLQVDVTTGLESILPASFTTTSIAGNVTIAPATNSEVLMVPSSRGELGIFAGGGIAGTTLGMMDADPGLMPGLFSVYATTDGVIAQAGIAFGLPIVLSSTPDIALTQEHNKNLTHAGDPEPVYVYSESDIGSSARGVALVTSKQARIYAGQDIINMMFFGQNLNDTDITRIVAGRDIIGTSQLLQAKTFNTSGSLVAVGSAESGDRRQYVRDRRSRRLHPGSRTQPRSVPDLGEYTQSIHHPQWRIRQH